MHPGGVNPQQGMGIIPTLFGIHQGVSLFLKPLALVMLGHFVIGITVHGTTHKACIYTGQGGISEPLTAEQQHQVRALKMAVHRRCPVQCSSSNTLKSLICVHLLHCSVLRWDSLIDVSFWCNVQAFLSRLLLMLGSFVIMCLLLF